MYCFVLRKHLQFHLLVSFCLLFSVWNLCLYIFRVPLLYLALTLSASVCVPLLFPFHFFLLAFFQQSVFPPNTFSFLDPVFALDSNVSLAKAFFAMDKDLCMSEKADCRQRLPTSVTIAALCRQGFCSFFFSVALQAC